MTATGDGAAFDPGNGPGIEPGDRLGLTLCLAIIVHAMVVLGVSFAPEPVPEAAFEALDVILVSERSDNDNPDARVLAQANLEGGGEADAADPPAAPVRAPLPAESADIASTPVPPVPPQPSPSAPEVTTPAPPAKPAPDTTDDARAAVEQHLVVEAATADLVRPEEQEAAPPEAGLPEPVTEAKEQPRPAVDSPPLPTAAQLLTRSFALASVNADLQQRLDSKAERPRRKYISANTREYRYAAYMEAWRAKVERIGNINYPDEARARKLSGNLLLDVALDPDGSVREIIVRRSSGHKVLDDAAVRIVELAAPFAPFPEQILEEVDILHITRTWKFVNNQSFEAR